MKLIKKFFLVFIMVNLVLPIEVSYAWETSNLINVPSNPITLPSGKPLGRVSSSDNSQDFLETSSDNDGFVAEDASISEYNTLINPEDKNSLFQFSNKIEDIEEAFLEKIEEDWRFQFIGDILQEEVERIRLNTGAFITDHLDILLPSEVRKVKDKIETYYRKHNSFDNFYDNLSESKLGFEFTEDKAWNENEKIVDVRHYRLQFQVLDSGELVMMFSIKEEDKFDLIYKKEVDYLQGGGNIGKRQEYFFYGSEESIPDESIGVIEYIQKEENTWGVELYSFMQGESYEDRDTIFEIGGSLNDLSTPDTIKETMTIKEPGIKNFSGLTKDFLDFYFTDFRNMQQSFFQTLQNREEISMLTSDIFGEDSLDCWNLLKYALGDDSSSQLVGTVIASHIPETIYTDMLEGEEVSIDDEEVVSMFASELEKILVYNLLYESQNVQRRYELAKKSGAICENPEDIGSYISEFHEDSMEIGGVEYKWEITPDSELRETWIVAGETVTKETTQVNINAEEGSYEKYKALSLSSDEGEVVAEFSRILAKEKEGYKIVVSRKVTETDGVNEEVTGEVTGSYVINEESGVYSITGETSAGSSLDFTFEPGSMFSVTVDDYNLQYVIEPGNNKIIATEAGQEIYRKAVENNADSYSIVEEMDIGLLDEDERKNLVGDSDVSGKIYNRFEISDYEIYEDEAALRENKFFELKYSEKQPPSFIDNTGIWSLFNVHYDNLINSDNLPLGIKDATITEEYGIVSDTGESLEENSNTWVVKDGELAECIFDSQDTDSNSSTHMIFNRTAASSNVDSIEVKLQEGSRIEEFLIDFEYAIDTDVVKAIAISNSLADEIIYNYDYSDVGGKEDLIEWIKDSEGNDIGWSEYHKDGNVEDSIYWVKDSEGNVLTWSEYHVDETRGELYEIRQDAVTISGEPFLNGSAKKWVFEEQTLTNKGDGDFVSNDTTLYQLDEDSRSNVNSIDELKETADMSVIYKESFWKEEEGSQLYKCVIYKDGKPVETEAPFKLIKKYNSKNGQYQGFSLYIESSSGYEEFLNFASGQEIVLGGDLPLDFDKDGEIHVYEAALYLLEERFKEFDTTDEMENSANSYLQNVDLFGLNYRGLSKEDVLGYIGDIKDRISGGELIEDIFNYMNGYAQFIEYLKSCFENNDLDWLGNDAEKMLALGLVYHYGNGNKFSNLDDESRVFNSSSRWVLDFGNEYVILVKGTETESEEVIGETEAESEEGSGAVISVPRGLSYKVNRSVFVLDGDNGSQISYFPFEVNTAEGGMYKIHFNELFKLIGSEEFKQEYLARDKTEAEYIAFKNSFQGLHFGEIGIGWLIRAAGYGIESIDSTKAVAADVLSNLLDSDKLSNWAEEDLRNACIFVYEIEGDKAKFIQRMYYDYELQNGENVILPWDREVSKEATALDCFFTVLFGSQALKALSKAPNLLKSLFKGLSRKSLSSLGKKFTLSALRGAARGSGDDAAKALIGTRTAMATDALERSLKWVFTKEGIKRGRSWGGLFNTMGRHANILGIIGGVQGIMSGESIEELWQNFKVNYSLGGLVGAYIYGVSPLSRSIMAKLTNKAFKRPILPQGITSVLTPRLQLKIYEFLSSFIGPSKVAITDSLLLHWGFIYAGLYNNGIERLLSHFEQNGQISTNTANFLRGIAAVALVSFIAAGTNYGGPRFRNVTVDGDIVNLPTSEGSVYSVNLNTGEVAIIKPAASSTIRMYGLIDGIPMSSRLSAEKIQILKNRLSKKLGVKWFNIENNGKVSSMYKTVIRNWSVANSGRSNSHFYDHIFRLTVGGKTTAFGLNESQYSAFCNILSDIGVNVSAPVHISSIAPGSKVLDALLEDSVMMVIGE